MSAGSSSQIRELKCVWKEYYVETRNAVFESGDRPSSDHGALGEDSESVETLVDEVNFHVESRASGANETSRNVRRKAVRSDLFYQFSYLDWWESSLGTE